MKTPIVGAGYVRIDQEDQKAVNRYIMPPYFGRLGHIFRGMITIFISIETSEQIKKELTSCRQ